MIDAIRRGTNSLGELALIYGGAVALAAAGFSAAEGVSYGDALYWACTTAMTVGYGDISPHTLGGKVVAVTLMHLVPLVIIPLVVVRLNGWLNPDRNAFTHEEQEELLAGVRRLAQGAAWLRFDQLPAEAQESLHQQFGTLDDAREIYALCRAAAEQGGAGGR